MSWPFMHFETLILSFMSSYDWNNFVLLKETLSKFKSKKIWATSYLIWFGKFLTISILIVNWISPYKITKKTWFGYLFDSINVLNIFQLKLTIKRTDFNSGEIPPWTHKNLPLTKQERGKQSNMDIILSYTYWSYLLKPGLFETLHYCLKLKYAVNCRHSWFPLNIKIYFGIEILSDKISIKTSIEKLPRST